MTDDRSEDVARFLAGLEADGALSDPLWRKAFGELDKPDAVLWDHAAVSR